MYWSNVGIDQVKPISSLDLSKVEGLRGTFNWKNAHALSREVHQHKGTKFVFLA